MRKNSRTSTLWIIVFFGGTIFQYWRGSQIDTLIYATVTALLLLASQEIFEIPQLGATSFATSVSILLACTLVFILSRIHTITSALFYLALIPLLLRNMWRSNTISEEEASSPAIRRSSWIWFTIGLLTCLAELGNYFAADVTHNDKAYPTITVLVDPIVADTWGKVVFVIVWAGIGVGLLRVSTER